MPKLQPLPCCKRAASAKAFRGVQALNDVQLTLRAGETHALMGANGPGKSFLHVRARKGSDYKLAYSPTGKGGTTSALMLPGVYQPDAGTIHFAGKGKR